MWRLEKVKESSHAQDFTGARVPNSARKMGSWERGLCFSRHQRSCTTLDHVLAPAFLVARREVDDVLGLSAHKYKHSQIASRLRHV